MTWRPLDGRIEDAEVGRDRRRFRWALVLGPGSVIVFYVFAAVLLLPPDTPIVDEPIYASSAFEFAQSGVVHISNLSAPNAVFDTVWGGLFVMVLGESYKALRISTIVLTAISGPFVYVLCRTLGGARSASVLGVAAYLLTPLAFSLSVTFQTDSHFLALISMTLAMIACALVRETRQMQFLLLGSGLTALAFLSRPQALVVMIAGATVWLLFGGKQAGRLTGTIALTGLPGFALVAHTVWTSAVGEPYIRELSRDRLLTFNFDAYFKGGIQGLIYGALYIGVFALPLLPLLLPAIRRGLAKASRLSIYLAAAVATATMALLISRQGLFKQGSWVQASGLGAVEGSFLGSRAALPFWTMTIVTVASALSMYSLVLSLAHESQPRCRREPLYFTILTLLGFVAAAVISTLGAHPWILDRYWLPLLPIVVALSVSGARVTLTRLWVSWSLVALLGITSVVGMVDAFSVYRTAIDFADEVVAEGVDPLSLEAGASWAAATFGLSDEDPRDLYRPGPFWIKFYAVDSDPEYGIVLEPLENYEVLERREYKSVLHPGREYLYLVHRDPSLPFYGSLEDG